MVMHLIRPLRGHLEVNCPKGKRDRPGASPKGKAFGDVGAPSPTVRDAHGEWKPAPPIPTMVPITHPGKRGTPTMTPNGTRA